MHLSLAALVVADYDEAIDFFVTKVGFELIEDLPSVANDGTPKRWVVVCPPGGETSLLLAEARGEQQVGAIGEQFGGRVGLFLTVEDFDAQHRRMADAGVTFLTEPRDGAFGRFAVWQDIAGNKWDLIGPSTICDPYA